MSLILPCAGSSTRFPNMKPKWLLTAPSGNLMIQEALKNIDKWLKDQVTKDIKDLDHCCRFHCVPDKSHKEIEFK